MRKSKTFKAKEKTIDIAGFAVASALELLGLSRRTRNLTGSVRVTVETIKETDELAIDPLLIDLGLTEARGAVIQFLEYRQDELRKPVKTVAALKRLLGPFATCPASLKESVEESIQQTWTGIFFRGTGPDRTINTGGESDGGKW